MKINDEKDLNTYGIWVGCLTIRSSFLNTNRLN